MRKISLIVLSGLIICGVYSPTADALPPFKKAFDAKYVQPANNPAFTTAAEAAGCMICHVKGQKKNVRNPYGEALAKLIDGDAEHRIKDAAKAGNKAAETAKVLKELEAAFSKVEAEKSPAGPTYGELLKQHKLPQ
ncbi:MAG: hypothetical protein K8T91_06220 [Planctomycetes bacterium]|nr:hypothetical protein [Planctomycetota bacterium]